VIRTLWFYIVVVASTTINAGLTAAAGLLGIKHRPGGVYDKGTRNWGRWILSAARTSVEVQGLERIPEGQPVVYISNHSSNFDIWALALVLPGSVRFVGKKELTRIPVLGRGLLAAGHISIDRVVTRRAFQAYDRAALTIRGGISVVVFPEGTRTRTGELLPFKNAPFVLAIRAQVPVVPVYVHDTYRILPRRGIRLHPMPIRIRVGEPIATAGMNPEARRKLREVTEAAIREMRGQAKASSVLG